MLLWVPLWQPNSCSTCNHWSISNDSRGRVKTKHRVFRSDELEQLVNSILNLEQLDTLKIEMDTTGSLLVELCARLKDLKNLPYLYIHGNYRMAEPQALPNERHAIRNTQQMSWLETVRLYSAILGESTIDIFLLRRADTLSSSLKDVDS